MRSGRGAASPCRPVGPAATAGTPPPRQCRPTSSPTSSGWWLERWPRSAIRSCARTSRCSTSRKSSTARGATRGRRAGRRGL